MCPWGNINFNPKPAPRGAGARPNVIAAFNQAHTVEELLESRSLRIRFTFAADSIRQILDD
jgi:hypothetical protein